MANKKIVKEGAAPVTGAGYLGQILFGDYVESSGQGVSEDDLSNMDSDELIDMLRGL